MTHNAWNEDQQQQSGSGYAGSASQDPYAAYSVDIRELLCQIDSHVAKINKEITDEGATPARQDKLAVLGAIKTYMQSPQHDINALQAQVRAHPHYEDKFLFFTAATKKLLAKALDLQATPQQKQSFKFD